MERDFSSKGKNNKSTMSSSEKEFTNLGQEELHRYSRQMLLSEIGISGQQKLKNARVLIVGIGGLGTPAALYLVGAGVGTIGLVDDDQIDVSNLQRQILYGMSSIGLHKLNIADAKLHDLNPHVNINLHKERITALNALEIIRNYDIVIDGSDNFQTRYLVNDASVLLGIPDVYGSIYSFDGQVSIFGAVGGPCYRCLYPNPPDQDTIPNCSESGVLGVLPGIIGTMQAAETLKIILGIGKPLIGRLLLFDALSMKTHEIRVSRNSECSICGDNPTITELQDYEKFCGTSNTIPNKEAISVEQFSEIRIRKQDHFLLDVREEFEFDMANIGGTLIPAGDLVEHLSELPHNKPIVVLCHVGVRSSRIVRYLKSEGFDNAVNLTGGISAWSKKIDNSVPQY